MVRLPKTLERDPLIDAIFEVRLIDAPQLADILPGFLLHHFEPKTQIKITRLPTAEIPFPMRKEDANLQFAPTQRIDIDRFSILVGDQNIQIGSSKALYAEWPVFKPFILKVMSQVSKIRQFGTINRYSIKFVNLIQAPTYQEQIKKISMDVKLGNLRVGSEHFRFEVHHHEKDATHILSIVNGAEGQIDGKDVSGVLVNIDSIRSVDEPDI